MVTALKDTHTNTWADGTVQTTTWHNTRGAALNRVTGLNGRVFSSSGGCLGKFRAVSWAK
jgi:hypothetical protein